jgi:peptidoglycan hydrolase-like protein with peptidoglycan-binding domain
MVTALSHPGRLITPGLLVTVASLVALGAVVVLLTHAAGMPNPYTCGSGADGQLHPVLTAGVSDTSDQCVHYLQWDLQRLGYSVTATGNYDGPTTASAVKDFQAKHGLSPTGSTDAKTWAALDVSIEGAK